MMTLREAMERLFDDAFTHPITTGTFSTMPTIDLLQNENDVILKAALPGLSKDDIQISVTDNLLTLRGEFKEESEEEGTSYHIREQRHGSFERSIRLPADVEVDKAKADFENGILKVILPKAEKVKPKTIAIKAK